MKTSCASFPVFSFLDSVACCGIETCRQCKKKTKGMFILLQFLVRVKFYPQGGATVKVKRPRCSKFPCGNRTTSAIEMALLAVSSRDSCMFCLNLNYSLDRQPTLKVTLCQVGMIRKLTTLLKLRRVVNCDIQNQNPTIYPEYYCQTTFSRVVCRTELIFKHIEKTNLNISS